MKPITVLPVWFSICVCITAGEALAGEKTPVYPGKEWTTKTPKQVGLDSKKLRELSDYAGGFGCVWNCFRRMSFAQAMKTVGEMIYLVSTISMVGIET